VDRLRRVSWRVSLLHVGSCPAPRRRDSVDPFENAGSWREMKTQLAELSDDLATNRGTRLKVKLETSDGHIVEVNPPVVVYITTDDGQEHAFCSPLRATFEGGAVEIEHNCGRGERILGSEITKVEVQEY